MVKTEKKASALMHDGYEGNFCGTLHKDIPYAWNGGMGESLDLYMPYASRYSSAPVLLFLHGGSWIRGDKSSILKGYKNRVLNAFLKEGYAVISADYRLAGYGATLCGQISDCRKMLSWINRNAPQYALDRNNVGIWGSSAGAHIGMFTAYTADQGGADGETCRVSYIIDNFAPVNLSALLKPALPHVVERAVKIFSHDRYMRRRVILEAVTGCDISEKEAVRRFCHDYSLDNIDIKNPVPTLLLHGKSDRIVPYRQSVNMYGKLEECGVEAEMRLYEKLDHGFRGYTEADIDDITARSLNFAIKHRH